MHLRRSGRYIEAVKEFKKAGGTHLILCQLPMVRKVIQEKGYRSAYEETIAMAQEAQQATGITLFVTLGPYPADYLELRRAFGRATAVEVMRRGMEDAKTLCEEHQAIAIGEIGRPHFHVDTEAWDDSNALMRYGMELAGEAGVAVVLHTESMGCEGYREIAGMAEKSGLDKAKVVKHFSPPLIREEENHGLFPSVLASKKAVDEALAKGTRFVLETDYIDDPRRPGAVLGVKTIPKRIKECVASGKMTEDMVYTINVKNPESLYGVPFD
jgi:TatD-related deoxyribonuclease